MTNYEKFKDQIIIEAMAGSDMTCVCHSVRTHNLCCDAIACEVCKEENKKWLNEEYIESPKSCENCKYNKEIENDKIHFACMKNLRVYRNKEDGICEEDTRRDDMTNHEMILTSAMRYALGRKTYIVGAVCDEIRNEMDNLSAHCLCVMIEDIERQATLPDGFGYKCDEDNWARLHDELSEEYERRE